MQRVWIVVGSVWALLVVVAVLAWSQRPAAPLPQAAARTLVLKTVNGKQQLVLVQQPGALGAPHATTSSSAAPR